MTAALEESLCFPVLMRNFIFQPYATLRTIP